MYSKINVDVSCKQNEFEVIHVSDKKGHLFNAGYKVLPIIRGSSTVNGDSAHSNTYLARQHNYVTFNVKKIKVLCSVKSGYQLNNIVGLSYFVLFKVPYIDENNLPKPNTAIADMKDFILYKSPEIVLSYNCISLNNKKANTDFVLYCNKPVNVGPNDYLGICYFPLIDVQRNFIDVNANAEVTFKPI